MGIKETASTFHTSRNTVRKYVRLFLSSGKSIEQLLSLSDGQLDELFGCTASRHREPSPGGLNWRPCFPAMYPDIADAYSLSHKLRLIYSKTKVKGVAYTKLARWFNDVQKSGIDTFRTIEETIYNHYENILNFFDNRSTNASAESFNAKIKAFRRQLRGVSDISYFLFRLCNIYA